MSHLTVRPDYASLLFDIITEKMRAGEMFTAFTISLALQKALKQQNKFDSAQHRHRYIKNEVHKAIKSQMISGLYDIQLQNVGAPELAFVYYPSGSDPSLFQPLKRYDEDDDLCVINVSPTPQLAIAYDPPDANDDGTGLRKPDARGSILVPASLLRKLEMPPSCQVYVYRHQNDKLLIADSDSLGDWVARYTVDYHGCVRITKATLNCVGLDADSYEFEVCADTIVVSAHK